MTTETVLSVKNGDTLGAVRRILKTLLNEKFVDELLVPVEVPSEDRVTPTIVRDPLQLDAANPLAPVMRINAASVLTHLQGNESSKILGAVLHPCELRAVVELAKVGRIDPGRLMLIGIDCMGTYEPRVYAQIARASRVSPTDEMLRWARQGPIAPYRLRNACQMCEQFTPENADLSMGLIGMNIRDYIIVHAPANVAAHLGLTTVLAHGREKALARLGAIRHQRREQMITDALRMISDPSSLVATLAECNTCGECLEACPFCGTSAFMPQTTQTSHDEMWSPHHLDLGMFSDLNALGRRAASCVSCGMCESACEKHAPLAAIQAALGRKLQEAYHYVPGRDIHERLPWMMAG
jgi:formate dehydrogenase subunit beta